MPNSAPLTPRFFPLSESQCGSEKASYIEQALSRYFVKKGIERLKIEDKEEFFDEGWLSYQKECQIYANLLARDSFDPRKMANFMERFGFYSGSHAYSLQVSILGIVPFWRSQGMEIRERVGTALKAGDVLAFGLSEQHHGADLYSTGTLLQKTAQGYQASGSKYYIGNANCAGWMSVLARDPTIADPKASLVFFGMQPKKSPGFKNLKKIRTAGVRSAFVGGFDLDAHKVEEFEILSRGDVAWDSIFGTVNLGKFMLGFGSLGICERAFFETLEHVSGRELYKKKVIDMPHIQSRLNEAFLRMWGMRRFGDRAIDYMYASDRRSLLYNSVQKARVTTEGVKVVNLLYECMGARAVEAPYAFESAYREIAMLPSLEGSTHINFGLIAKFAKNIFLNADRSLLNPEFNRQGHCERILFMESGKLSTIRFHDFQVPGFEKQLRFWKLFLLSLALTKKLDPELALAIGQVSSVFVQAQLVAESKDSKDKTEFYKPWLNLISRDLSEEVLVLLANPTLSMPQRFLLRQMIVSDPTPKLSLELALDRMGWKL